MPLSESRQKERTLVKRATEFLRDGTRYVDFALELRVIDRDSSGDYFLGGQESSYRILEIHRYGGKLDTLTQEFIGPAESYVIDHVSPDGWEILNSPEPCVLLCGGEGSGKSELAATWAMIQIVSQAHPTLVSAGITAPTTKRLDIFRNKLQRRIPKSWGVWREKRGEWALANNLQLDFVGAKKYSEELGSRMQGYTWGPGGFAVSDEFQDHSLEVKQDIESRGRGAFNGIFKRFCTATPKDFPEWRDYLASLNHLDDWKVYRLPGPRSIFIHPSHWDRLRKSPGLTEREYRRRYLAEELPPESLLYYAFARARNVKPKPFQGDITSIVTNGFDVIVGHDPGTRQHTSEILKCFKLAGNIRAWWVIGEVITKQTTTQAHGKELAEKLALLNVPLDRALILTDPHETSQEASPLAVIRQFQLAGGLRAERACGQTILKEDRIDMLNSLCHSVDRQTRLYLDVDSSGQVYAPELLRALETQVRDASGKAETGKKDETDHSHATAATAYGLYAYERVKAELPYEQRVML